MVMKSLIRFLITQSISAFNYFLKKINELKKVKHRPEATKKRKVIVCNAVYNSFNQQKGKLDDEYNELFAQIKKTLNSRYNVENMFLEDFIYKDWFVPPLEGDEKVPFKLPLEGERKK